MCVCVGRGGGGVGFLLLLLLFLMPQALEPASQVLVAPTSLILLPQHPFSQPRLRLMSHSSPQNQSPHRHLEKTTPVLSHFDGIPWCLFQTTTWTHADGSICKVLWHQTELASPPGGKMFLGCHQFCGLDSWLWRLYKSELSWSKTGTGSRRAVSQQEQSVTLKACRGGDKFYCAAADGEENENLIVLWKSVWVGNYLTKI